jgi:hypoxanthine phosphoribosyltransferase
MKHDGVAAVEHPDAAAEQILDADHVGGAVLDVFDVVDPGEALEEVGRHVEARVHGDVVDHDRQLHRAGDALEVIIDAVGIGSLEEGR